MAISEYVTEQKLKSILLNIYIKGIEKENVHIKDVIEEIKDQLLADSK